MNFICNSETVEIWQLISNETRMMGGNAIVLFAIAAMFLKIRLI